LWVQYTGKGKKEEAENCAFIIENEYIDTYVAKTIGMGTLKTCAIPIL
jgi:hypothetical protein